MLAVSAIFNYHYIQKILSVTFIDVLLCMSCLGNQPTKIVQNPGAQPLYEILHIENLIFYCTHLTYE